MRINKFETTKVKLELELDYDEVQKLINGLTGRVDHETQTTVIEHKLVEKLITTLEEGVERFTPCAIDAEDIKASTAEIKTSIKPFKDSE